MKSLIANQKKYPPKLNILKECRAVADLVSVPFSLLSSKFGKPQENATLPILMFPGFGTDDRYLKPMANYLRNLGWKTEGWGLGRNLAGLNLKHTLKDLSSRWEIDFPEDYSAETYRGEAGVPLLCDKAIARVEQRSKELGSQVIIVGWSLGGYIARECARELPNEVAQIITLGTPIFGGPKYTSAAKLFKAKNFNLDWIEESIERRDSNPIKQPITCVYSRSDGVVSEYAAKDTVSPNVNNIEIDAAHLGMGFNRKVWKTVKDALALEAKKRSYYSG